jgi:hypothetical protein
MKRWLVAPVLAATSLLAFAACGGEQAEPLPGDAVTIQPSETSGTAVASAADRTPDRNKSDQDPVQPTDPSSPAEPTRPGPDECTPIGEAADGRYQVFEAGTAVVRHSGNRLKVGKLTPATGWTARVDSADRDDVQVEFRKGGSGLDLSLELDDGLVEVEICHEQDDDD